jgi:hypothetical protein
MFYNLGMAYSWSHSTLEDANMLLLEFLMKSFFSILNNELLYCIRMSIVLCVLVLV